MDEIAASADVGKSTICNCFRTKEDPVVAFMADFEQKLQATLRDLDTANRPLAETLKLSGIVQADETYVGGRRRIGPTNKADRAKLMTGRPGPKDKKLTPVVALVERKGRVRVFPVERVDGRTLQEAIRTNLHLNAHMMTDDLKSYHGLDMGFAGHDTIKHSEGKYVRGHVHTNTVEGFFSLLKRGINGTFHHVGKGHLHRYCSEFEFRYNRRDLTDGERAAELVLGAEGKRLTYKQPSGMGAN